MQLFTYFDRGKSTNIATGLAHSLLNPPYGIRITIRGQLGDSLYAESEVDQHTKMLTDFVITFFNIEIGQDSSHLVIYSWSDDWSNYFDAGKEWWGTFFWTIFDTHSNLFTVIGASTTD